MSTVKKNERANANKEVKCLCNEFGFASDILIIEGERMSQFTLSLNNYLKVC